MMKKVITLIIVFCLIFEQAGFSQAAGPLILPSAAAGFAAADKFRPVHLRSISIDAGTDNLHILLDKGDLKDPKKENIGDPARSLLRYFFTGLNLPNESFWVNLRPDSPGNIIDNNLARTDIGRIMLEADVQLKKDTAKYTSPNCAEGRRYWNKLYQKAEELFGGQDLSIPTVTRPWIVPDEIILRQARNNVYIYKATLKVMLEADYLKSSTGLVSDDERLKILNDYSSQLIRETVLPKLTRDVNTSKRYAGLRQVYYSLILAQWFKARYKNDSAWKTDSKDLTNLVSEPAWDKDTYFKQYRRSFQEGEYNIQENVQTRYGLTIRQYFSGGIKFGAGQPEISGDIAAISGNPSIEILPRNILTAEVRRIGTGNQYIIENIGMGASRPGDRPSVKASSPDAPVFSARDGGSQSLKEITEKLTDDQKSFLVSYLSAVSQMASADDSGIIHGNDEEVPSKRKLVLDDMRVKSAQEILRRINELFSRKEHEFAGEYAVAAVAGNRQGIRFERVKKWLEQLSGISEYYKEGIWPKIMENAEEWKTRSDEFIFKDVTYFEKLALCALERYPSEITADDIRSWIEKAQRPKARALLAIGALEHNIPGYSTEDFFGLLNDLKAKDKKGFLAAIAAIDLIAAAKKLGIPGIKTGYVSQGIASLIAQGKYVMAAKAAQRVIEAGYSDRSLEKNVSGWIEEVFARKFKYAAETAAGLAIAAINNGVGGITAEDVFHWASILRDKDCQELAASLLAAAAKSGMKGVDFRVLAVWMDKNALRTGLRDDYITMIPAITKEIRAIGPEDLRALMETFLPHSPSAAAILAIAAIEADIPGIEISDINEWIDKCNKKNHSNAAYNIAVSALGKGLKGVAISSDEVRDRAFRLLSGDVNERDEYEGLRFAAICVQKGVGNLKARDISRFIDGNLVWYNLNFSEELVMKLALALIDNSKDLRSQDINSWVEELEKRKCHKASARLIAFAAGKGFDKLAPRNTDLIIKSASVFDQLASDYISGLIGDAAGQVSEPWFNAEAVEQSLDLLTGADIMPFTISQDIIRKAMEMDSNQLPAFINSLKLRAQQAIAYGFDYSNEKETLFAYFGVKRAGIDISPEDFTERVENLEKFDRKYPGYFMSLFTKAQGLKDIEVSASETRQIDPGDFNVKVLEDNIRQLIQIQTDRIDVFRYLKDFEGSKVFSLHNLYYLLKREQAVREGKIKPGERFRVEFPSPDEMKAELVSSREEPVPNYMLYYQILFKLALARLGDKLIGEKCLLLMRDVIISDIVRDPEMMRQMFSRDVGIKIDGFRNFYEDYKNHLPNSMGVNIRDIKGLAEAFEEISSDVYKEMAKVKVVKIKAADSYRLVPQGFLSVFRGRAGMIDCSFDQSKGHPYTRSMHEDTMYYFVYKGKVLKGYIGLLLGQAKQGKILTVDTINSPSLDGEELLSNVFLALEGVARESGCIGVALPDNIGPSFNFKNEDTIENMKVYKKGKVVEVVPVHQKNWKNIKDMFGTDTYNSIEETKFRLLDLNKEAERAGAGTAARDGGEVFLTDQAAASELTRIYNRITGEGVLKGSGLMCNVYELPGPEYPNLVFKVFRSGDSNYDRMADEEIRRMGDIAAEFGARKVTIDGFTLFDIDQLAPFAYCRIVDDAGKPVLIEIQQKADMRAGYPELDAFARNLDKRLSWPDTETNNVGYVNGEVVLIDFGGLKLVKNAQKAGADGGAVSRLGGIDLRRLPVNVVPGSAPGASLEKSTELDGQWQKIQDLVDKGLLPETAMIKEYLQACRQSNKLPASTGRVLSCIADIFRLEEDRCQPTDPALKDLATLLEQ